MIRLTGDIALVGGGTHTGFGISGDFDAHVYLLDGGDEAALIDCGMGTAAGIERLLANIASAGVAPDRVRRLLLTHYHTDHAGGARRYRERLGLRVGIGADAADALESADHTATQFGPARDAGVFPADYDYPACPVDDRLADGQEIAVGRLTVRYLATAGHCRGHGCYLVRGPAGTALLSGDAVFHGGRLLLQSIPDCDLGASVASLRRLAAESFQALLPGHGAIALQGGPEHVAAALAAVDRLALPPNLV
jgi:glyoxylase-like metal-dependent hydrolase (beta-lactamase superfamily II)